MIISRSVSFLMTLAFSLSLTCMIGSKALAQSLADVPRPAKMVQSDENPLSIISKITPFELEPGQAGVLEIEMNLPEGYKAYLDMFHLEPLSPPQMRRGDLNIEPVIEFFDEFTGKKRKGVELTSLMKVNVELPQNLSASDWAQVGHNLKFRLTYQACTKTYCLFPKTVEVPVAFRLNGFNVGPTTNTASSESGSFARWLSSLRESPVWKSFFSLNADEIAKHGLPLLFLIVFVAGFLTSLTPCVFPMIPITLAVLGKDAHARTKTQQTIVSQIYVLGIALTYALLGLFAASTGALFGQFMSSPYVLGFICALYFAMAMSLFGFFELELPLALRSRIQNINSSGYLGVFLTGAASGIVASPCVGPVLVGILTYVAKTQNLFLGFWLLFVFALGMGQLFLLLGLSSQATKFLPRSGPWMETVKHIFGLGMLGACFYFLHLLIPEHLFKLVFGVSLIVLGIKAGAFEKTIHRVRKGGALALFVFGILVLSRDDWFGPRIYTLSPGAQSGSPAEQLKAEKGMTAAKGHQAPGLQEWHNYSAEILEKARSEGKPVLIDFYADWCAACIELEKKTFPLPEFQEAAKRFYLVRFDATNDSDELTRLRERFEIIGLPTIVFLDSQGSWVKDATIVAFQDAKFFSERMNQVK